MSPFHQQDLDFEHLSPLSMKSQSEDRTFRISSRMQGDRLLPQKDGQHLEDLRRRSRTSPLMTLPTLNMSGDYFSINNRNCGTTSSEDIIDGVLEVIDSALKIEDDWESDDDVMVVPIKLDNYASKRSSRLSRGDKRRQELLLDNAFAITDALRVYEEQQHKAKEVSLSSGDLESLYASDVDNSEDSDRL